MSCRLCNGPVELVAPMSALPPVDSFFKNPVVLERIPADLYLCSDCGHVQLQDVISPEMLFRDYLFHTSDNPALVAHFEHYARDLKRFNPRFVVEIGSNDGTLLKMLNTRILGVDPSSVARESAIPVINDFFTNDVAQKIVREHGKPNLIIANHVFAHADDISEIVMGIKNLLARDGVFVFEAAYLHDLLDNGYYDTVYHEHLSYHSVEPLIPFFERHGLELFSVQHNLCKGGSIRGFVQHTSGARNQKWYLMNFEKQTIADTRRKFLQFNTRLQHIRDSVSGIGRAIGYGASASGMSMMFHTLLRDKIEFLVDDDPRRQGLFGDGLKVKNPEALYASDLPIVILATRYTQQIMDKHPASRSRFVPLVPVMNIERDGACWYG